MHFKRFKLKKLHKNNVYLLWAEQRSNAIGNSIAQTQASDSSSTLNQEGINEENDQDQAIDIVEFQEQSADGNEIIQDQLSANENAQGQFTYWYK